MLPDRFVYGAALALVVAAALLGIWWPAYVPGQDTPHHLFFAQVLASPERFAGAYDVTFAPTSQLFVYLATPLVPLGLPVAAKIVRTLGLALTLAAFARLGRAVGVSRGPAPFFGAAMSAGFYFAMGFENFALAIPPAIASVAFAITAARGLTWRPWLLTGLLLAVTAIAHAVVAGMIGIELLLVTALFSTKGVRWRQLGRLLVVSLPAGLYAIGCAWLSIAGQAARGVTAGLGSPPLSLVDHLEHLSACSFSGYSRLGLAVLLVAVVTGLAELLRRPEGELDSQRRRLLAATTLLWSVVYLLVPFHVSGWAYAQPRVLLMSVFLPCGLLAWRRWQRLGLVLTGAAVLASLVSAAAIQQRAGASIAAQVARWGDGPVGEAMTVAVSPGRVPAQPYAKPLFGVVAYAVARGGATPTIQAANRAIHAVTATRPPEAWPPHPQLFIYRSLACRFAPAQCRSFAIALADQIAVEGLAFDTILLTGRRRAIHDRLTERGYEAIAPDRFEARPSQLVLRFPVWTAAPGRLTIRVGYPGSVGWFRGAQTPIATGQTLPPLVLGPLPAGPVHVECQVSGSGGQAATAGSVDRVCHLELTLAPSTRVEREVAAWSSPDAPL